MKHPSTLYKKLVRGVLLLAFIAVALILGNRLGILSHSVKNAGLVILLFVCNMALALGARHAIERAVWPESWKRGGAAGLLVLCFAVLLFADSDITDLIIGEKGDPVDEATAQLAAAATWVGAYVVAWKPFLRRKENRYISACVSLTLGCIAFALFFVSLYSNALLGVVGWKVEFVRFALASVAFASSISAFIVQWDTREVRRRKEEVERLVADRVEIRYFDPADDLDEAERFAPVGVRLEPGNENAFQAWIAGRDAMCEALVRATHFYGAYYQGRLAGFSSPNERASGGPIRSPAIRSSTGSISGFTGSFMGAKRCGSRKRSQKWFPLSLRYRRRRFSSSRRTPNSWGAESGRSSFRPLSRITRESASSPRWMGQRIPRSLTAMDTWKRDQKQCLRRSDPETPKSAAGCL